MAANLDNMCILQALKLSVQARTKHDQGAILSYMQIDTQKLNAAAAGLHMVIYLNICSASESCMLSQVWSAPFQFALCIALLFREIGWSCLVGTTFLILVIPAIKWVASTQRKFSSAIL